MSEALWNLQKQVLESKRLFLCDYLDFSRHYIFLQCFKALSRDDVEEIQATEHTRKTRVSKMLDKLLLKGPGTFETLCESVTKEGTQNFIRETLEEELDKISQSQVVLPGDPPRSLDTCSKDEEDTLDSSGLPKPGDPGAPALPTHINLKTCNLTSVGSSQV